MAFGLAGLLVTLGVVIFIMKYFYFPDIQASQHAQQHAEDVVNQISGKDENGNRIEDTYTLFADERNDGKLQDFQVTQVNPGSPMETMFGLKANDVIIAAIDGHTVRTDLNGLADEDDGRSAIRDAYTTGGKLIIQRGDQQLTLPVENAPPKPNSPPQTAQNPQQHQNDGGQNDTMDEIHQRLHALPTY
jgi:hypothetical protein